VHLLHPAVVRKQLMIVRVTLNKFKTTGLQKLYSNQVSLLWINQEPVGTLETRKINMSINEADFDGFSMRLKFDEDNIMI